MMSKGELHDLAFAMYFVFCVMVLVKVFIQRFKFGIFDFIVILDNFQLSNSTEVLVGATH